MNNARTTSSRSRANRRARGLRCRGRVRLRRPVLSKVVDVVSNTNHTLARIDRSEGALAWSADSVNGQSACAMNDSGPHIVYTILGEPKPPWVNAYPNEKNAWTNALEFAIVKAGAAGKDKDKDALAAVTTYLHGGHGLTYDVHGGNPNYKISGMFYLTGFMEKDPHGSIGNPGNVVCCYDMAGAVTSLGCLLGADVKYCKMDTFGYINKVDLIGQGLCNNPFYPLSTSGLKIADSDAVRRVRYDFGNHAFAECCGLVFDACAGPVLGVLETDYIAQAIDVSTPSEAAVAGTTGDITRNQLSAIE